MLTSMAARVNTGIDAAARRMASMPVLALLLMTVAAIAIRISQFDDPQTHVDENFYLLVGDRMLHGALPYVDIWDRKPIGLFLIYAGIRCLGGGGIVQYHLVAALFAAATAFLITRIASRIAGPIASAAAGIIYLLMLEGASGGGGQSPVFYNLFTAGAALATLKAAEPGRDARGVVLFGGAAMLLVGIAIQIKYNAVFEGGFFGLALMMTMWRVTPRLGRVAAAASLWIGLALLPTAMALAYYVLVGQANAFLFANFWSIMGRVSEPRPELIQRLLDIYFILHLALFGVILSIILQPWRSYRGGPAAFAFVLGWLGTGLLALLGFGTYFDHYALPVMLPLAIALAPALSYSPRRVGGLLGATFIAILALGAAREIRTHRQHFGGAATMQLMVDAIKPRLTGCLWVFDGDSILYYLTGACLPTKFAFPQHLLFTREAGALGIDPEREVRRIMASKPQMVVDAVSRDEHLESAGRDAQVRAWLKQHYRVVRVVHQEIGLDIMIYERVQE
jgi:4-amino-4-deoxy-L-arabinose transferase-like glycosyltransferase